MNQTGLSGRIADQRKGISHYIATGCFSINEKMEIQSWNKQMVEWTKLTWDQVANERAERIFPQMTMPLFKTELELLFKSAIPLILSPESGGKIFNTSEKNSYLFKATMCYAKELNVVVVTLEDHTDSIQKQAKLNQQIHRIEESNKTLDGFIHTISHDLKEPIRGIISLGTILQEDKFDQLDEEARFYLKRIIHLGNRSIDMIEYLMQFAKIGQKKLKMKDEKMVVIYNEAIELLSSRIKEKEIEIQLKGDHIKLRCDLQLMTQVFVNLIQNGIKYNKSKRIKIEVSAEKDHSKGILIHFIDNGIGIPENKTELMFGLFTRLSTHKEFEEGNGVGLAIVKKAVEIHEGTISVSRNHNKGSKFTLCFPPAS